MDTQCEKKGHGQEEQQQALLDHQYQQHSDHNATPTSSHQHQRSSITLVLAVALLLSLAFNAYLSLPAMSGVPASTQRSTTTRFDAWSDWWGPGRNDTRADELWESINSDDIAVAVSSDYVEAHALPPSNSWVWDSDKHLYFIKGIHQMHCLKAMRRFTVDIQRGNKPVVGPDHILHCLQHLRQDISCYADPTLMPITQKHGAGDGQVMQCRSWPDLVSWTRRPENEACYRQLGDYEPVKHTLERFGYCPKDSPYRPVMEAYFELHGHKDPFGA